MHHVRRPVADGRSAMNLLSVRRIARECGMTPAEVTEAISQAVAAGLLTVDASDDCDTVTLAAAFGGGS